MGILKVQVEDLAAIAGAKKFDVNPNASSYTLQLQPITLPFSAGTFAILNASAGTVDSVKVNGVEQLSAPVAFNTDEDTTAVAVAANIQANGTAQYTAAAVAGRVTLTAKVKGGANEGHSIVVATSNKVTLTVVADRKITYPGDVELDPASSTVAGTFSLKVKPYGSAWFQGYTLTNLNIKDSLVQEISGFPINVIEVTLAAPMNCDVVRAKLTHLI